MRKPRAFRATNHWVEVWDVKYSHWRTFAQCDNSTQANAIVEALNSGTGEKIISRAEAILN